MSRSRRPAAGKPTPVPSGLRAAAAAVCSFLLVVVVYVAFHESLHVAVNWLLAGELADRCGQVPIVLDPYGRYLATCYASGGAPGVNAAATLVGSGAFGGAIALLADRAVGHLPSRVGLVAGATGSSIHLAWYLSNTGTVAPGSGIPTDSGTVIATLGVEWLLPAAAALLLSTVAIATTWWRLVPALGQVDDAGPSVENERRSGSG